MSGTVLESPELISRESLADIISYKWDQWKSDRAGWEAENQEMNSYIFATDTSNTSASDNPWKNRTTIPKLCNIRDNLHSNYVSALFPNDDWMKWEGYTQEDDELTKRDKIQSYVANKARESGFESTVSTLLYDYIEGNAFFDVIWVNEQKENADGEVTQGYVGPRLVRTSPLDQVFDPTAICFKESPTITRSIITVGEMRLKAKTNGGEWVDEAISKSEENRASVGSFRKDDFNKINSYAIDGFGNMYDYYTSGYVEVLEFQGTMHDIENGVLLDDYVITVIDRTHVVRKEMMPNWTRGGFKGHSAWRRRPDNLYGMGPLNNLVGMQYRLDHLENAKADAWDLVITPMFHTKGDVDEFVFEPGGEVHSAEDGNIEPLTKPMEALQVNNEIGYLMQMMEEMAGAPKQAMGIRTPGEKTAFEVQSLDNAAGRIFQEKITQFEKEVIEPALNAYLELAVNMMDGTDVIRVMDDDFGVATFMDITKDDLTAKGKIRPIGARHFAHQAQLMQNLQGISNTAVWQKIERHYSSKKLAKLVEDGLQLSRFDLFSDNQGMFEDAESAKLANGLQQSNDVDAITDIDPEEGGEALES